MRRHLDRAEDAIHEGQHHNRPGGHLSGHDQHGEEQSVAQVHPIGQGKEMTTLTPVCQQARAGCHDQARERRGHRAPASW